METLSPIAEIFKVFKSNIFNSQIYFNVLYLQLSLTFI